MKKYLELMKAASEKRQALNKYLADTPNDKQDKTRIVELRGELEAAETAFNAAVDTYDESDTTESRQLSDRIELRNYMTAAMDGKPVSGAEAEFNKEVGLGDTNIVPWEALEERQDVATTVPDDAVQRPRMSLLNRIFENTRVAFLGIRMPSVAMGEPVFPVMSAHSGANSQATDGSGKPGSFAEGGEVDAGEATFTAKMVSPKRLSARYLWRMEQTTRFPIEDTLRSDLRIVMGELLDQQILNGKEQTTAGAVASDFNGLIANGASAPLGVDVTKANAYNIQPNTLVAFQAGLDSVVSYVDGKAANMANDVRTLIGVETYRRMVQFFRSGDSDATLDWWLRNRLNTSFAVSSIIADKTGGRQQAIQTRRPGDCVAPVWRGITMIRDPYSGAAKAEVSLTAHMLANVELLRTDNWRKIAYALDA